MTTKQLAVPRSLKLAGLVALPTIVTAVGEGAARRFVEFFAANIRNKNTRLAYGRAVWRFCHW